MKAKRSTNSDEIPDISADELLRRRTKALGIVKRRYIKQAIRLEQHRLFQFPILKQNGFMRRVALLCKKKPTANSADLLTESAERYLVNCLAKANTIARNAGRIEVGVEDIIALAEVTEDPVLHEALTSYAKTPDCPLMALQVSQPSEKKKKKKEEVIPAAATVAEAEVVEPQNDEDFKPAEDEDVDEEDEDEEDEEAEAEAEGVPKSEEQQSSDGSSMEGEDTAQVPPA
jgi:histone H3/H4